MSGLMLYDPNDSDTPRSPQLQKLTVNLCPEQQANSPSPRPRRSKDSKAKKREEADDQYRPRPVEPGQVALLSCLNPNDPVLSYFDPTGHYPPSESESECDQADMMEITKEYEKPGVGDFRPTDSTAFQPPDPADDINQSDRAVDCNSLGAQAIAALQHGPDNIPRRHRSGRSTPLIVDTKRSTDQKLEDSITTSPTLSKHVLTEPEGAGESLPALQSASPTKDEKLPSIRQMTGHGGDSLSDLAEAATKHDARAQHDSHHHSRSVGSAPSPGLPYHPHAGAHTSPSGAYAFHAGSPISTVSETCYGSPKPYHTSAYFATRRPSTVAESTPRPPASLPSTSSSSGTSQGPGYSTTQTTPIDSTPIAEGTPKPFGQQQKPGPVMSGFKCEYPNCNAAPFQTQYLLSSHRNVHSQRRDHFCPVPGCKRGENGEGFKRKNEMKRHSLVHRSPGYTCPFCPDREHRYPRPDNLQRHVRVHHVDKDRDDPALREVLAQRSDGASKTSRRRRNTTSSM